MAAGTSSDSFLIDAATELLSETINEGVEATAAEVLASGVSSNELGSASNTVAEPAASGVPKARTVDDYDEVELDNILALNNFKPKKFKSKTSKFNKLNDNNLL